MLKRRLKALAPIISLKMTSPRFAAVKSTSFGGLELILPVQGQKVKGIGPGPLEVLLKLRGGTSQDDQQDGYYRQTWA